MVHEAQPTFVELHHSAELLERVSREAKGYDDAGWGCAYRSLQSIISWFRLQQYTAFRNPTHYEIQQRLVDHCGQSRDELLGKKMWICLLYTSPSPRDRQKSRMPSSA